MLMCIPKMRQPDDYGSGEFGAPRGDHKHRGIDFAILPNTLIVAPVSGMLTKFGYAYGDDLSFRYVQITDYNARDWRLFYVLPDAKLKLNSWIGNGDIIGTSQALGIRYPGITPHVHVEIRLDTGEFVNPKELLNMEDE